MVSCTFLLPILKKTTDLLSEEKPMPKLQPKKKKRTRKNQLPPGINLGSITAAFARFKKGLGRTDCQIFSYEDMLRLCSGFADSLMQVTADESNDFEKQRFGHATHEIFDILK